MTLGEFRNITEGLSGDYELRLSNDLADLEITPTCYSTFHDPSKGDFRKNYIVFHTEFSKIKR